jgi:Ni,Fe-hydrogenase III large subunit
MPALIDLLQEGAPVRGHAPWPRRRVTRDVWSFTAERLDDGDWTLLDFWASREAVHMALFEDASGGIAVLSLDCTDRVFPSVAKSFPPASRLERAIHDLYGFEPADAPDRRAWLDHGQWPVKSPLGAALPAIPTPATDYRFLAAEGDSLHRIPVGPVHAGIIEPGHFRFAASGETVVRLEARLGYAHKGIEGLMRGAELLHAGRLAGRISGDSTVAYAFAFARAVEAALDIEIPPRAVWLRALMAELERIANHLGDIGAICNDAAFALMHAHCGILREEVLRAAAACFGHRLMMDCVVPAGVAVDLDAEGRTRLDDLVREIRKRFPELIELYDNTASLQDRTTGAGTLTADYVRRFGCGGYVGRASGHSFDARRRPGYPPYDALRFEVPTRETGDVNARIWIRIEEVRESLSLVEQILEALPDGRIRKEINAPAGSVKEGAALVEGFRGDIFAWVQLAADGTIESCRMRDPSWFQWPLLEAAIDGNIVADFPLCNKSFNCSYSGHDL